MALRFPLAVIFGYSKALLLDMMNVSRDVGNDGRGAAVERRSVRILLEREVASPGFSNILQPVIQNSHMITKHTFMEERKWWSNPFILLLGEFQQLPAT